MSLIKRYLIPEIYRNLSDYPVIGIIGPRQVGKSTLVKYIKNEISRRTVYLDLQLPSDRTKLTYSEDYFLNVQEDIIILDEIQRNPELLEIIRALVDRLEFKKQFIVLGSASPGLLRRSSESLAGRIAYHELTPFNLIEMSEIDTFHKHWLRGGYPKPFLMDDNRNAFLWLKNYIVNFIERDLVDLGLNLSRDLVEKALFMISSIHGQTLNNNMLARSLGVTNPTVKKYIEILHGAFIIRLLKPYHVNVKKRLVKSPKIYIRDSGILHEMNGLRSQTVLNQHIIAGASWEGYVIEQLFSVAKGDCEFYFYRTHNDAEIDLVIKDYHNKIWAIEIKNTNAPKLTRGYYESVLDINPDYQFIITPTEPPYKFSKEISVSNLNSFILNDFIPNALAS